jgi:hypothetical protein
MRNRAVFLIFILLSGCSADERSVGHLISRVESENKVILSGDHLSYNRLMLNMEELDGILSSFELKGNQKIATYVGSIFSRGVFLSGNESWGIDEGSFSSDEAVGILALFDEYKKNADLIDFDEEMSLVDYIESMQHQGGLSGLGEVDRSNVKSYLFFNRKAFYRLYLEGYDFSKYAKNSYLLYEEIGNVANDFGFRL